MLGRLFAIIACLLLVACTTPAPRPSVTLPLLQLAPAALGTTLSTQQQLRFRYGSHERTLDALLEVDGKEVRLLVQALGQTGVRLQWDGLQLHEQRAAWLPPSVRGARVLDDLQFALWPEDVVRRVLPSGWTLQDDGVTRSLQQAGTVWLELKRQGDGRLQLENRAEGYQLEILSSDNGGETP